MSAVIAVVCAGLWAYLVLGRGGFWLCRVRDDIHPAPMEPGLGEWPSVVAVVPARDEAGLIRRSLRSLLEQDYPGTFSVIVVDDNSTDDTAAAAGSLVGSGRHPLTVLAGRGLPPGWTGKLWALHQGIGAASETRPDYLLLTDADIVHAPDTVSMLVRKSLRGGLVLASLMARLRCISPAERIHVPAFVYFFQMLFPFSWVERRDGATAAAAGGCMLVRADALRRAGGIGAIRNALIDDCALASRLKTIGPIWLGLTDRAVSIRPYETFAAVRDMISRSAYAQLRYSPALLAATIAAMLLTFAAPPALAVLASGWPGYVGAVLWLAMAASFVPTLRFYRLSPLWGFAMPAIALLYMCYTLHSALRHIRRRGGRWKGRVHVNAPGVP